MVFLATFDFNDSLFFYPTAEKAGEKFTKNQSPLTIVLVEGVRH